MKFGLREGQWALATRISEVEKCISVHHVREFMHRLLQLESRLGNTGGTIGDTLRNCVMKLDQCTAETEDLRARMREQEWYHDLSDQESDDEYKEYSLVLKVGRLEMRIALVLRIVPTIERDAGQEWLGNHAAHQGW